MKLLLNKKYLFILIPLLVVILLVIANKFTTEGIGPAGISLSEFEQISFGMTQLNVNKIIDSTDLWDNDEIYNKSCIEIGSSKDNSVYTYTYKYIGEKSGYAIIVYSVDYSNGFNGLEYPTVITKENHNLK